MMIDWQISVKMDKPKKGKSCPWYAPSLQNTMIKTFFANMRKKYGWQWTQKDFENDPYCLGSVIKSIYSERFNEYVSAIKLFFILIIITANII